MGGSDKLDTAIYLCKKCKVKYMSPLNEIDQKKKDKSDRTHLYAKIHDKS